MCTVAITTVYISTPYVVKSLELHTGIMSHCN